MKMPAALNEVSVRFELDGEVVESRADPRPAEAGGTFDRSRRSSTCRRPGNTDCERSSAPRRRAIAIERTFSYDPPLADPSIDA